MGPWRCRTRGRGVGRSQAPEKPCQETPGQQRPAPGRREATGWGCTGRSQTHLNRWEPRCPASPPPRGFPSAWRSAPPAWKEPQGAKSKTHRQEEAGARVHAWHVHVTGHAHTGQYPMAVEENQTGLRAVRRPTAKRRRESRGGEPPDAGGAHCGHESHGPRPGSRSQASPEGDGAPGTPGSGCRPAPGRDDRPLHGGVKAGREQGTKAAPQPTRWAVQPSGLFHGNFVTSQQKAVTKPCREHGTGRQQSPHSLKEVLRNKDTD